MTFEKVKNTVLILLVSLSLFLTWQLWTFQPDYAFLKHNDEDYVDNTPLSDVKGLSDIIRPQQLIFHHSHNKTIAEMDFLNELYNEVLSSKIEGYLLLDRIPQNDLFDQSVEFVFPTPIPGDILLNLFPYAEEGSISLLSKVESVILYTDDEDEEVRISFLAPLEQMLVDARTSLNYSTFKREYLQKGHEFSEAMTVFVGSEETEWAKKLYIPKGEVMGESISYTTSFVSVNVFKNLLFSDPLSAKYFRQGGGEESYTDGNRMISLLYNRNFMDYINPIYTDNQDRGSRHIVISGYDFINGHGGWTDNYQLYDWTSNSLKDEVGFRLVIGGIPVIYYHGEDLVNLHVTRTGSQISRYQRPLFDLDSQPIDAIQQTPLPSGEAVISELKQREFFQFYKLENIAIGYEMKKRNAIVTVEPYWFMLYDGKWQKITFE